MNVIAPPDPDTHQPRYTPPALACDAHCHVFGPAAKFPYAADRPYTPPDAPFERLAQLHTILGLERAVIVHASCHGTDPSVTLDAIASSHGRCRGTGILDQEVSDAELERLHAGGIRGTRFNFVKHLGGGPDLHAFHRTVARVAPFGWHLVLHLDAADLIELRDLFSR